MDKKYIFVSKGYVAQMLEHVVKHIKVIAIDTLHLHEFYFILFKMSHYYLARKVS